MSEPSTTHGALLLHPSRRPAVRDTVARLKERLARERPGYVLWTFQQPMDPVVDHARQVPPGSEFQLVPLLLAPGAHFAEDVQQLAAAVREAAPALQVRIRNPLLEDVDFVAWLLERL